MAIEEFLKIYSKKYSYQIYDDCFYSETANRITKWDSVVRLFVYPLQRKQQKWI
jgi:hypothetical protein